MLVAAGPMGRLERHGSAVRGLRGAGRLDRRMRRPDGRPGQFEALHLSVEVRESSDQPSDNALRRWQTESAAARHRYRPDLAVSDLERRHQTELPGMACKRSGVRIPIAPPQVNYVIRTARNVISNGW